MFWTWLADIQYQGPEETIDHLPDFLLSPTE